MTTAVVILALWVGIGATQAPPPAPVTPVAPEDRSSPAGRSAPRTNPGEPEAPPRPNRSPRRNMEPLTAEQLDAVIEVAAEISPEWGEALKARRAKDPEELRSAVSSAGPRLLGLAMLKESHPELYAIRIEDLRIQNDLKALARAYRASIESNDGHAVEHESRLRDKVARQVDLDLRARAMELKALDQQLKRMVEELTDETRMRNERIDRVLAEIKSGEEPRPMVRPGFGPGGERDGRESRDSRGPRGTRRPNGGAAPTTGDDAPSGGGPQSDKKSAPAPTP